MAHHYHKRGDRQARLISIPKPDQPGETRPLTVLPCVYRIWTARLAANLGVWSAQWFPSELLGGCVGG